MRVGTSSRWKARGIQVPGSGGSDWVCWVMAQKTAPNLTFAQHERLLAIFNNLSGADFDRQAKLADTIGEGLQMFCRQGGQTGCFRLHGRTRQAVEQHALRFMSVAQQCRNELKIIVFVLTLSLI